MNQKLYLRIVLLLAMVVLTLAPSFSSVSATSASNACRSCRRACWSDYQQCLSIGALGCDEVYADCVANCPCP
ncbi:MAG: hypothetical protein HY231_16830 [Acidobacteria bacterium]|nr:hypothetical protein [Acidobacteriota bacterium]